MTDSAVLCPRVTAPSNEPAPSRDPDPESDLQLPLWLQWHASRDPALREQIISLYRPHTRMLAAKTYARRTHDEVPFADYYQLASVGLIEAVDRFDPFQGIRFEAYCGKRIVGAILNGLEMQTEKTRQISVRHRLRQERLRDVKALAESATCRKESAETEGDSMRHPQQRLFDYLAEVGIGVALGVLLEDTGMIDLEAFGSPASQEGPEATYFRNDTQRALREALGTAVSELPQNQQMVIQMHYLQGDSFTDIAAKLQLTKGRISQLHKQALMCMRQRMRPTAEFDRCL